MTLRALLTVFALTPFALARDIVTLDRTHQTIEHFGASDCWRFQQMQDWPDDLRAQLADLLFSRDKGIGLSAWRFNAGGGHTPEIHNRPRSVDSFDLGDGTYDWSRQSAEQWFLRAARDRGVETLVLFSNSPPRRLTRNGRTFGDEARAVTTNLRAGAEPDFARFLCDVIEHFKGEGVAFDYVSPINEPQWAWDTGNQEGSRYSNADLTRTLRAVAAELDARALPTLITAPESGHMLDMVGPNRDATRRWRADYGNYAALLANDPVLAPRLGKRLATHSYFSDKEAGDEWLDHRRRTRAGLDAAAPGWSLWQSEYCVMVGFDGKGGHGRDLGMGVALDVVRFVHADLTMLDVTAWHWWTAVSDGDYKDGLVYAEFGPEPKVIASKLLWAFGNYSKFVRPGMTRVDLAGDGHAARGVFGSAYVDPAAKAVVAVYANAGAEARTVDLHVDVGARGWRLAEVTRHVTSDAAGDDLRAERLEARTDALALPGRSVMTFVLRYE